jgi:hypothetical protein
LHMFDGKPTNCGNRDCGSPRLTVGRPGTLAGTTGRA